MENITMPITIIGEPDWIEKLTAFLESYDVEVAGLDEMNIGFHLPEDVMEYYQNFGGIDSSDFMYNLYKPEQLISLSQSQWSFVKENFAMLKCNRTLYLPKAPATTRFRTMKFL